MKYLKTFEHFAGKDLDLGHRFSGEEESEKTPFPGGMEEEEYGDSLRPVVGGTHHEEEEEECEPCGEEEEAEDLPYQSRTTMSRGPRVWGDEVVEAKKAKPDFLDLDKDGDKKESMKKAAKDAKEKGKDNKKEDKKEDKKDEKELKGLSASQKKLPPALQKAILAKKKK